MKNSQHQINQRKQIERSALANKIFFFGLTVVSSIAMVASELSGVTNYIPFIG